MSVLQGRDATDEVAIAGRVLALMEAHGYTTNEGGYPEEDKSLLYEAIYAKIRPAVAESKQDRARVAVTKGALVSAVFSDMPGAEPGSVSDLDEFDQAVYRKIEGRVWNTTHPDVKSGQIQRMLGDRNTGLVLIREKLRKEHDPIQVVYVSANEEVILEFGLGPMVERMKEGAKKFGLQSHTVIARRPEMEESVTRTAKSATRQVNKAVKSYLELEAGSTVESNGAPDVPAATETA